MRTITAMDLRRKMGEWLDRASAREWVLPMIDAVERHGLTA